MFCGGECVADSGSDSDSGSGEQHSSWGSWSREVDAEVEAQVSGDEGGSKAEVDEAGQQRDEKSSGMRRVVQIN